MKNYWNNFLWKWSVSAIKQMQKEKESFISDTPYLRVMWIKNNEWFRSIYREASAWTKIDVQVILSPMYTNEWKLSTNKDYFKNIRDWLEWRVNKKVIVWTEIVKYLQNYFNLNVNYIIADSWMLIKDYDKNNLNDIVDFNVELFADYIKNISWNTDFNIKKMSDTWFDLDRVRNMNFQATREDCINLINNNSIYPETMLRWLDVLINAYWVTVAYYELDAYFRESKFIWDNYKNNIIVNIEWTSIWNKTLINWKENMSIARENAWNNLLIAWVLNAYNR